MNQHLQILFTPLLPLQMLAILASLGTLAVGYAFYRRSRGALWRLLTFAVLLLILGNPVLLQEQREPLPDTALIVVDDSASMQIGERKAQVQQALQGLTTKAGTLDNLKLETIHVSGRDETSLFHTLTQKLAELPRSRLAGIILLTDGQIHDVPESFSETAPLHLLLAGHQKEVDRQLALVQAPAYGIVGSEISLTLRVEDEPKNQSETALVTLHNEDGTTRALTLPVGKDFTLTVPISHAGNNFFAFTTETLPNEITPANNGIAVNINGIRDRLRVLLISGEPHAGERVWRNFLKGDPAVDLVHFTILRSPEKLNIIPNSELALIPFPVQELFETKLTSFDLIIFDRFHRTSLIAPSYLENIASYVENGGALLVSDSTASNITEYLSASPLARVLPVEALNTLLTGPFIPETTTVGARHPVTAPFYKPATPYGHWFRQIASNAREGSQVLMQGLQNQPLLVLNHVGAGRVAEFTSDQFWLWARNYDGGGPQAELLRRTSHWLMREPELEEMALVAQAEPNESGWQITVTERNLDNAARDLAIIDPSGQENRARLVPEAQPGLLRAKIPAQTLGLYRLRDNKLQTMVMVGANGTPEFSAMIATADKLASVVKTSGGSITWLEENKNGPELRRTNGKAVQNGWNWIGLQHNGQYRTTGSREKPLMPGWALLSLLLISLLMTWRQEGKN